MDLAELGISIRSDGVAVATDRLNELERQSGRTEKSTNRMQKQFNDMARDAKRMAAIAGVAMAGLAANSIRLAIDAEETANKFRVVFRGSVAEVNRELVALTRTIPATISELRGMAAGVQDLLVPMGVARGEAAGMSVDMIKLAGDLASFNNVPTAQVLEGIKSALAGSSEPMRRFGVDTRITRLEQIALRDGLIQTGQEMDNAAMATAVMTALMEDSADAIGDAERTMGDTANQLRFMSRNFKQVQEDLGAALLPVFNDLLAALNDSEDGMSDLESAMRNISAIVLTVAAGVAALSSLFVQFGQRVGQFLALADVVGSSALNDVSKTDFIIPILGLKKIADNIKEASSDGSTLKQQIEAINAAANDDGLSTADSFNAFVDNFLQAADRLRNGMASRELSDPGGQGGGDMFGITASVQAAQAALAQLSQTQQANQGFAQSLAELRAELAGPLAEAQLEYNQRLADARAMAEDGKITAEQLTEAERLYGEALAQTASELDGSAKEQEDYARAAQRAREQIGGTTGSLQNELRALQGGEQAWREYQRAMDIEQSMPLLDPEMAEEMKDELRELRELAGQVWDEMESNRAQDAIEQLTASFHPLADAMLRVRDNIEQIDADLNAGLITEAQAGLAKVGIVGNAAFDAMQAGMEQGSDASKKLAVAQQALNTVLGISAVLNTAATAPWPANFAAMAQMVGMVASLGVSVGGLGGGGGAAAAQEVQGTGSVLGDPDAKSESIANALDITADATSDLVGINRGMLTALQSMQEGIAGASGQIARGTGQMDLSGAGGTGLAGLLNDLFDPLGILGALGFSDVSVENQGIELLGNTIREMADGATTIARAFADVETSSFWGLFSDTDTETSELSAEFNDQLSLIFRSMIDTVTQAGEALGIPLDQIQARIDRFEVETQRISLMDLSAEEQQAELEAVFGRIFDDLASSVIPFIGQFQQVGEGMGETLVRVATSVQVAQEAIRQLGLSIDDNLSPERMAQVSVGLVEAAGGIENFISQMQNFVQNFAPEAHQFDVAQSSITRALEGMNMALPESREGFWNLLQSIDATTEAGQEQIATLLGLQGAADDYYSALEAIEDERAGLQRRMLQLQGDEAALRELELASLDESNRAMQQRVWALEEEIAIANEREGLEQRLLQLQGDTAALRALELEQLDEANRAMQERIWALEDEQELMSILEDADMSFLEAMAPAEASLRRLVEQWQDIEEQAIALGASEEQLTRIRRAANAELARWISDMTLSTLQLAEDFFSAEQSFTSVGSAVTDTMRNMRDVALRALGDINDWLDSSQLSDISPLTPEQRLAESESQFMEAFAAAMAGDFDALSELPGLADAFLGEAANFFGTSTSDFQQIWDMVRGMMENAAGIEAPAEQQPPNAGQVNTLIERTTAFGEQIANLERELSAWQLADQINALALAQEETPFAIARELGFTTGNMRQILEALGADVGDGTEESLREHFNDVVSGIAEQNPLLTGIEELAGDLWRGVGTLEESLWLVGDALVQILEELGGVYIMPEFDGPALVDPRQTTTGTLTSSGAAMAQNPDSGMREVRDELHRISKLVERGNNDRRDGLGAVVQEERTTRRTMRNTSTGRATA